MANKQYYVNDEIKFDEVLTIGSNGEQLGVLPIKEALRKAEEVNLDLILVSAGGKTPVCKIMDYGKFIYGIQKKEKANKKSSSELKEIRMTLGIDTHDMEVKAKKAQKELANGNKVKAVVMFKGRELAFKEIGFNVIQKFIDMSGGAVDRAPKMEGRYLSAILKKQG